MWQDIFLLDWIILSMICYSFVSLFFLSISEFYNLSIQSQKLISVFDVCIYQPLHMGRMWHKVNF